MKNPFWVGSNGFQPHGGFENTKQAGLEGFMATGRQCYRRADSP
jgi:hypothetical protein